MPEAIQCPRCGAQLPGQDWEGLCPKCLLRVWRWRRRKPVLAGLAGSTALLLLVLVIGSPIAALHINRERQHAEQNAVKSQQAAQFLRDILKDMERSVRIERSMGRPALVSTTFDKR